MTVNREKAFQINNLYKEIEGLRGQFKEEIERLEKVNFELREKISEITIANEEETELLKIKMSELRHADLNSLKKFY